MSAKEIEGLSSASEFLEDEEEKTNERTWRAGVKRTRAAEAARLTVNIAIYLESKQKGRKHKLRLGEVKSVQTERQNGDATHQLRGTSPLHSRKEYHGKISSSSIEQD